MKRLSQTVLHTGASSCGAAPPCSLVTWTLFVAPLLLCYFSPTAVYKRVTAAAVDAIRIPEAV